MSNWMQSDEGDDRRSGFTLPVCLRCLKAPVITINIYLEDREHVLVDGEFGVLGTGKCTGCGAIHGMILTPALDLVWYRFMEDGSISSLFKPRVKGGGIYDEEDEEKRRRVIAAFVRLVNPWFTSTESLAARYGWFGVFNSKGAPNQEEVDDEV